MTTELAGTEDGSVTGSALNAASGNKNDANYGAVANGDAVVVKIENPAGKMGLISVKRLSMYSISICGAVAAF